MILAHRLGDGRTNCGGRMGIIKLLGGQDAPRSPYSKRGEDSWRVRSSDALRAGQLAKGTEVKDAQSRIGFAAGCQDGQGDDSSGQDDRSADESGLSRQNVLRSGH